MGLLSRLNLKLQTMKNVIKALPDLLFYVNEALFFKKMKRVITYDVDIDLLGARMRELAHILEKDIYILGKPRFKHLENELSIIIRIWQRRFSKNDSTYQWALHILKSYKEVFVDDN